MKESDREDLASSSGLEPYAGDGNIAGVASARGDAGLSRAKPKGQPLSSEITHTVCRPCFDKGKATSRSSHGEIGPNTAESKTLSMYQNSKRENREILLVYVEKTGVACQETERSENVSDGTADMNANRKSDDPIVPAKWANKAGTAVAESMEERESPKGNALTEIFASDTEPIIAEYDWESYGIVERVLISTVLPEGGAV